MLFRKSQTLETNVYVLYVWLRICDIIAEKNTINEEYDEQKLMNNIEKIKDCMFLEINEAIKKIKRIICRMWSCISSCEKLCWSSSTRFYKKK